MTNIQTVHLIYGPLGAGKSTYARKIAAETSAVRFSIDEWMHTLFGDDQPAQKDSAWINWAMTRVTRCETLIWSSSMQILTSGRDVILDLGLLRATDRDRLSSLVEASGHRVLPCFVDADRSVRRQRVLQRNVEQGDTYSFDVTPAMFDAMEMFFERPTAEELRRSIKTLPSN
ncbi:AAA family ATPase [Paraherbaspirillum soli]|uniref:AAA family ATPase n=1 Tax=Paraherbaspirillum soli TaxID=631222 RepID=A0ABW0MDM8_9BURK